MADPPVELKLADWTSQLAQQLDFLRQSNCFCDIIIRTSDGATLSAHGNVLAASSPVFKALLQKNSLLVDVADIDRVAWNHLLNFIYLGKLTAPASLLPSLRSAATSLGLRGLMEALKQHKLMGSKSKGHVNIRRTDRLSSNSRKRESTPSDTSSVDLPTSELDTLDRPRSSPRGTVSRQSPRGKEETTWMKKEKAQRSSHRRRSMNLEADCQSPRRREERMKKENVQRSSRRRSLATEEAIEITSADETEEENVRNRPARKSSTLLKIKSRKRRSEPVKPCSVNLGSDIVSSASNEGFSDKLKACFVDLSPHSQNKMFLYHDDVVKNGYVKLKKDDVKKAKSAAAEVVVIGEVSEGTGEQGNWEDDSPEFICIPCKQTFRSKKVLNSHFDKRHRYRCSCGTAIRSKSEMANHLKKRPGHREAKENSFKLLANGDKMQIVKAASFPKIRLKQNEQQMCSKCQEARCSCDKQRSVSLSSGKWKCKTCAMKFPTARRLEQHLVQDHDIRCEKCSHTFTMLSSLKRHMKRVHSGDSTSETMSAQEDTSSRSSRLQRQKKVIASKKKASQVLRKQIREAVKKSQRTRRAKEVTEKSVKSEASKSNRSSRNQDSTVEKNNTSQRGRKRTRSTETSPKEISSPGRSTRKRKRLSDESIVIDSIDLTEENEVNEPSGEEENTAETPKKTSDAEKKTDRKLNTSFDEEKAEIIKEIGEKIMEDPDDGIASEKPHTLFDEEEEEEQAEDVNEMVGKLIESFTTPKKNETVSSSSPEHQGPLEQVKKPLNGEFSNVTETEVSSDCSMVIPVSKSGSETSQAVVILHQSSDDADKNVKSESDKEQKEAEQSESEETLMVSQSFDNAASSDVEKHTSETESHSKAEESPQEPKEDSETESQEESKAKKQAAVTRKDAPVLALNGKEAVVQDCEDGSILCVIPESE